MRFIKGAFKVSTKLCLNDSNFIKEMNKRNIQEKLDSFGKDTPINLGLNQSNDLIVEYITTKHTIAECRAVVKLLKKSFGNWFNCKCEYGFQAEGTKRK